MSMLHFQMKELKNNPMLQKLFPDLNIQFVSAKTIHKYDSELNTTFTPEEKATIKIKNRNKKIIFFIVKILTNLLFVLLQGQPNITL